MCYASIGNKIWFMARYLLHLLLDRKALTKKATSKINTHIHTLTYSHIHSTNLLSLFLFLFNLATKNPTPMPKTRITPNTIPKIAGRERRGRPEDLGAAEASAVVVAVVWVAVLVVERRLGVGLAR